MHMVAFGPVLVVPIGHAVHVRSVVDDSVGGEATISPLGQLVHAVHALALSVFEKKPLSQGLHAASVVELPIVKTYEPAGQTM